MNIKGLLFVPLATAMLWTLLGSAMYIIWQAYKILSAVTGDTRSALDCGPFLVRVDQLFERTLPGKHHRRIDLVARLDGLVVVGGAARLYHG